MRKEKVVSSWISMSPEAAAQQEARREADHVCSYCSQKS